MSQTAACDEQHPRSQSEVRTPRRDMCQDREPETVDKHKWSVVGGQDGIEGELLGPGCPPGERQGKKPRSQLRSYFKQVSSITVITAFC